MTLGQRIQAERKRLGLSQEGLGEALGLPEGRDRRYLVACAGALLPCVRTAVAEGGWPGVFP